MDYISASIDFFCSFCWLCSVLHREYVGLTDISKCLTLLNDYVTQVSIHTYIVLFHCILRIGVGMDVLFWNFTFRGPSEEHSIHGISP